MVNTITDDIFAATEQLLCLPPEQWGCRYRDTRAILCRRLAEPEFVPEQHARARALIDRIDMALRDGRRRQLGAHHKLGATGAAVAGGGGKANEPFFAAMLLGTVPLPSADDLR